MSSNFTLFIFSIIFLWLFIILLLLWSALSHYNKLGQGLKDKNFKSIIENFLKDMDIAKKDIDNLKLYCDKIQRDSGNFNFVSLMNNINDPLLSKISIGFYMNRSC